MLPQSVAKPSPPATGRGKTAGAPAGPLAASLSSPTAAAAAVKVPADMPGRFRCLPTAVQARIYTLTRDNHVVLVSIFWAGVSFSARLAGEVALGAVQGCIVAASTRLLPPSAPALESAPQVLEVLTPLVW